MRCLVAALLLIVVVPACATAPPPVEPPPPPPPPAASAGEEVESADPASGTVAVAAPPIAEPAEATAPAEPDAAPAPPPEAAPPTVRADCVVEESEPWPRPEGGGLGTMGYPVTETEKPFADRVFKDASPWAETACLTMDKTVGKEVSWFGVARGYRSVPERNEVRLLLENKHFDGLTDTHILCLSFAGGGDFVAILPGSGFSIQPLGVLRVYGRIVSVKDGVPRVEVTYARHFRWGRFCFMNMEGEAGGNPEWRKLCKVEVADEDDMYDPFPDVDYYRDRLGDPSEAAAAGAEVPLD